MAVIEGERTHLDKGHSKISPLLKMTPHSNSQLPETYPTATAKARLRTTVPINADD
jgi:hypothetical protein